MAIAPPAEVRPDPTSGNGVAPTAPGPIPGHGGRALLANAVAWGRRKPLIPLLVGAALAIALIAALLLWARDPGYRVLYSNLNDADGGKIIAALDQQGIKYQFAQGGHALLVPADKVYGLRLKLAEQGLPQAGNVGLSILDKQQFGISQFAEQVNYQRGLQGELASSIEALNPVAGARVNLALPKDSLFVREQQPAKATVILTLHPGRALDRSQVDAIVHLVASSVRDLAPDNVTVVDQAGHLLTRNSSDAGLEDSQLDYVHTVERGYQRRIEDILTPILGAGNVHAQVTAQLDFSHREETDERYAPNQGGNPATVRSQQVNLARNGGADAAAGIPGALSNTPPGTAPSPINNPPSSTPPASADQAAAATAPKRLATVGADAAHGDLQQDTTTNYEVNRNVTHVQRNVGTVERLSAAVVVNYRDEKQQDGKLRAVALSAATLKQVNDLTREAIGFSAARGDTLTVVNSPFDPTANADTTERWWQGVDWIGTGGTLVRYLLVLAAAIVLYRKLGKPLRRHLGSLATAATAPPAPAPTVTATVVAGAGEDPAADTAPPVPPRPRKAITYENGLKALRDMASKDPGMVAMIVRGWMRQNG